jgi:hypothetical protein
MEFELFKPIIFTFLLIVTIFYIPLLLMVIKVARQKKARKDFFHGILSILRRVLDDEAAVEQIYIVYKKLSERYPYVSSRYKNAADFIEDLFCRSEVYGQKRFKDAYGFEFAFEDMDRIVKVIAIMKTRQPFSSISSKYGNLLNMIKHAFDTSNPDLGVNNLQQLADDIEVLESTIESQGKRNRISIVVSIVGVILTLVFGALTVLQFISPIGMSGDF